MKYNLIEIFEMASNIEKAGCNFYTIASKKVPDYSDFFDFLAKEEVKHDALFKSMKEEVISKKDLESVWDPDGMISIYLDSLSSSSIFKNSDEIDEIFKDMNGITEVIDWAIKREHDTILFFIGLKSTLINKNDEKTLESIIKEEINHVHILMEKKSKLI